MALVEMLNLYKSNNWPVVVGGTVRGTLSPQDDKQPGCDEIPAKGRKNKNKLQPFSFSIFFYFL